MKSNSKFNLSRRSFLRASAHTLASSTLLASMVKLDDAFAAPADVSDYKALVCIFLLGGNDSFNWLVPTSNAYATYANSRSNLALAQNSVLPLNGAASDGNTYGIHPGCPEIQSLFNAATSKLAFLNNVGTLIVPTSKQQAKDGSVPLPPQLFSHIDQQIEWMTSIPNSLQRFGWAGRIADLYASQGYTSNLAMNINIGGVNYWQAGKNTIPYVLGSNGAPTLDGTSNTGYRNGTRASAASALLSQASVDSNVFVNQYAKIQNNAASKVQWVKNAFASAGDIDLTINPAPAGFIGSDAELTAQLLEVARCIKAHSQIGDSRQIFFVQLDGFDTHTDLLNAHQNRMPILSKNLKWFWDVLGTLGMQNKVTIFTASDFGRSIGSNGSGSDHGWGGHHLILGGAVQGGTYYGSMPDLTIGGANDVGGGQVLPTTATDQYAATLARWFGVADSDLNTLFPNLANFGTRNLGFLG